MQATKGQLTTKIVVLARDALYQAAWEALLAAQPALSVVGAAADPAGLAAFQQAGASLAVLVDWPQPTPQLVAEIKQAVPQGGVLILQDAYDLERMVGLLRAGATGCLVRGATVADLARALIAVGRGEVALPPDLAARALAMLVQGRLLESVPAVALTGREQEVLSLLARGLTNKDIAQTLILSVRTVEAHLHNIFGKLNLTSRTEVALWAVQNGFGEGSAGPPPPTNPTA